MRIRRVTVEDMPRVMPLVFAFHKETLQPFGMGFNISSVEQIIKLFAENHIGLVVEDGESLIGVIGGAIAPSFTDFKQKIFNEVIWYILPEFRGGSTGVKLLKLVEDYCRNIGVNKIVMVGMFNNDIDRLANFYNKMGYKELEIHFVKDITYARN